MASRFFQCLCGRFATINMFEWLQGIHKIECRCGLQLKINTMKTAQTEWARFIKEKTHNGSG